MITAREWLKGARYLPGPLKDFHDQKDVFKSIWKVVMRSKDKDPSVGTYLGDLSWTGAQVFVIDYFLYFMAAHGWTLQRSRQKISFMDLDETIKARKDEEAAAFREMMDKERLERSKASPESTNNG